MMVPISTLKVRQIEFGVNSFHSPLVNDLTILKDEMKWLKLYDRA